MRIFWQTLTLVTLTVFMAAPAALAAKPRPWECRDFGVFSATRPMTYKATAKKGTTWRLYVMKYRMGGQHLGYTIVTSRKFSNASGPVRGHLRPGRYFAVAVYHTRQDWWLCPAVHENDRPKPGVITDLCFGKHPGTHPTQCDADVTVKPAVTHSASVAAR